MNEPRKEIGEILAIEGKYSDNSPCLTPHPFGYREETIAKLLALVERIRHEGYASGYADAYNPHCSCREKVKPLGNPGKGYGGIQNAHKVIDKWFEGKDD